MGRIAWQDVQRVDVAGAPDAARGLAASEAGLRLAVRRDDRGVISLQAVAIFPGEAENIGDRPLGHGAVGAELRVLAGRSWGGRAFAEAQSGYRWRGDGEADEARLDLTLGWRPRERWLVMAQSFSAWSAADPDPSRRAYAQHAVQASAGLTTAHGDIHVGVRITPAGRNAISQQGVFVSLWRRF